MNVVDLVESARPDVAPMPLDQRRMVRERLFGAADDVVRTTIRERSASGAVTSTAPQGYRARRVTARPKRQRSSGSFAKMGAGLLVVGAAAAAGWSWYADTEGDDAASLTTTSAPATSTTTSTLAPATTTLPPTRTGVSADEPVLFPLGLIPVEEAVIDLAPTNGEYVLMRASDGTWVHLEVIDGTAGETSDFDFSPIGAVDVAPFSFGDGSPWIYTIETTCGAVRVVDAPAQEQYRPLMTELFQGMSVDGGGGVDALLPASLNIIEAAAGEREFRTVFRIDDPGLADGGEAEGGDGADGDVRTVTLRQVPEGSIAQLVPGGVQPVEMVWLGEGALGDGDLDVADEEVGPVSVFWRDASTVFAISSDTVPLDELESFVAGLRAASTASWLERFAADEIDSSNDELASDPDATGDENAEEATGEDPEVTTTTIPPCAPQPSLGPTFRP